jgi:hypothetical protein
MVFASEGVVCRVVLEVRPSRLLPLVDVKAPRGVGTICPPRFDVNTISAAGAWAAGAVAGERFRISNPRRPRALLLRRARHEAFVTWRKI